MDSSWARTDLASSPPRAEQAWRQGWDPAAAIFTNIFSVPNEDGLGVFPCIGGGLI
jgi:hypothetical protein